MAHLFIEKCSQYTRARKNGLKLEGIHIQGRAKVAS